MTPTTDELILDGLTRLHTNVAELQKTSNSNAADLQLLRQQIVGSEADKYEAGRLPRLEKLVEEHGVQIGEMQEARTVEAGEKKVVKVILRWVEKVALAGAGALMGSHLGHR